MSTLALLRAADVVVDGTCGKMMSSCSPTAAVAAAAAAENTVDSCRKENANLFRYSEETCSVCSFRALNLTG